MGGKTKQVTIRVDKSTRAKIADLCKRHNHIPQRLIIDLAVRALVEKINRDGGRLVIDAGANQGNADAGSACDAPGHCTAPTRMAAEARSRYGKT
jgi:hypothetical protein